MGVRSEAVGDGREWNGRCVGDDCCCCFGGLLPESGVYSQGEITVRETNFGSGNELFVEKERFK